MHHWPFPRWMWVRWFPFYSHTPTVRNKILITVPAHFSCWMPYLLNNNVKSLKADTPARKMSLYKRAVLFYAAVMTKRTTITTTNILWLSGFCMGQSGWAGTRRNIYSLTPIMVINHPLSAFSIYYDPWHPQCSIYVPTVFSTICLQVFFGLPLGLAPPLHTPYISSPNHCRHKFCFGEGAVGSRPLPGVGMAHAS